MTTIWIAHDMHGMDGLGGSNNRMSAWQSKDIFHCVAPYHHHTWLRPLSPSILSSIFLVFPLLLRPSMPSSICQVIPLLFGLRRGGSKQTLRDPRCLASPSMVKMNQLDSDTNVWVIDMEAAHVHKSHHPSFLGTDSVVGSESLLACVQYYSEDDQSCHK